MARAPNFQETGAVCRFGHNLKSAQITEFACIPGARGSAAAGFGASAGVFALAQERKSGAIAACGALSVNFPDKAAIAMAPWTRGA